MSKGFKIRRHNSKIYRRNRSTSHSPIAIAGMTVLVLGLFVVGWFVYPPVYDFITGKTQITPSVTSSEPPPVSSSSSVSEAPSEPEPEPANPMPDVIKAVYAPASVILDATKLESLLSGASSAGYNALLFDAKDIDGNVLYRTENATALKAAAIVKTPYDFEPLMQLLEKYKMSPIARIYTLKDHTASRKIPTLGVKYKGEEVLWLDNSVDKGGRSWLNPYSTEVQDYIVQLAQECVAGGVKMIVADGVQFPQGIGMNLATYGDTQNKTWDETLAAFVTKLEGAVTDAGAAFAVTTPVTALMDNIEGLEYLGAPEAFGSTLLVNAMPASLAKGPAVPGMVTPVLNPYDSVLGTLRSVTHKGDQPLLAFVQSYTDSTVPAGQNKTYTKEDVDAQLDALGEVQIASYILYNPDGTYLF